MRGRPDPGAYGEQTGVPLPYSLTVMAEYCGGPLWARPEGNGEPVEVSSLGLPPGLAAALQVWNEVYERLAITDFVWREPPTEQQWDAEGHQLAAELQRALPEVEVWYWSDGVSERVRGRRRDRPTA